MLNAFNTYLELSQSSIDTAVLPMGSLEPKGPHLPTGLDILLAERLARDFCAGKAVYLLPTFPFSSAIEARGFRGTVSLQQQTLWDVLEDVARFLARHRFKRLIVLDFANYNWILKHCVREINMDLGLLQAIWVSPRQFAREAAEKAVIPDYGGGAVDTSLAMSLFPDLVKGRVVDFDPGVTREYADYEGLAGLTPAGCWGKPTAATAAMGEKFYRLMLDKTREFVDYALTMFPGGAPLGEHAGEELWWPDGEIPGLGAEGLDWHASCEAIRKSSADTVILATSATEQHSPAMPLATDYLQALHNAAGAARELGAYLLPSLPFMTSWGHARFRGTVTLRAMTVRRVLEDTVASLHAGGWRKVAVINIHGGNWVVKPTIIEANRAWPDMSIIETGDILSYRGQAPVEQLHADEGEGSFIKAFYPRAFKGDKAVDFTPMCTASAFDFVGIGGVSPQGVWGYQLRATADKGRKRASDHIAADVEYIRKTFAALEKRRGK